MMSDTACAILGSLDSTGRAKLSGWIYDQNSEGSPPFVKADNLEPVLSRPLPGVIERMDLLLLEAVRGQSTLGERFNISEPRFVAATYSKDPDEVEELSRLLSNRGFIKAVYYGGTYEVLPEGYAHAETAIANSPESADSHGAPVEYLIKRGESDTLEFKSTLQWDTVQGCLKWSGKIGQSAKLCLNREETDDEEAKVQRRIQAKGSH